MKNNQKNMILDLVITALFAAVIAVSSQITFPLPSGIPVTLQTLSVAACGYCLGLKKSLSAVLTYLFMGLAGLPVFSGFSGGIPVLFGKTGGFIIGFVFLAFFCGISEATQNKLLKILLGIVGILLCHFVGIVWFSYLIGMNIWAGFLLVSLPFLLKDFVCVIVALLLSPKISKKIMK